MKKDNLEYIGTIFYEFINENSLNLLEVNSVFALRRAKLRNKNRLQSKIFSLKENKNFIYIEELNKWYFNNKLFKNEDIQVVLYESTSQIKVNISYDEENIMTDVYDELLFAGYLVYDVINYNYIKCKEYNSRLILEKDKLSERKTHIVKLYIKEDNPNIKYIDELNKWYYNSKDNYSIFLYIKLFDTLDELLDKIDTQEKQVISKFNTITENENSKAEDMIRLNENLVLKDLIFSNYILYEFVSTNRIKYELFETKKLAKEKLNPQNQISLCYTKKNDNKLSYIRYIGKWFNNQEETPKLYETDMDIPRINNTEKSSENKNNNNTFKKIVKEKKLIPGGWVYYTLLDENHINARHYHSSNELLNRLNEGGEDSQYYKSKIRDICYLQKLDKWYNYTEKLEENDFKIKLYDEKEIWKM